jgi:type II secretory pathway pseudopilin PulG
MEVIVAALLMAILAAATTPVIIGFIDTQRAQTTADKLADLGLAISKYKTAVLTGGAGTNSYPGELSELSNLIVSGVDKNSCGAAYVGTTGPTNWSNNGPFVTFNVSTTGYVTPIGTINDALVRQPASGVGLLKMQIPNVSEADVKNLDQIVDGGDGNLAGTVQWTSVSNGYTPLVSYLVPIANKC